MKYRQIDMKFHPRKNLIIKNKSLSVIRIKHFYSQIMNIFAKVLNKNLWGKFFSKKTKTKFKTKLI